MSNLTRNTTAAERVRGCVFSELFRDTASVLRNGGVTAGAPVIDKGITFDGLTQYLTYSSSETVLNSSETTFVLEFYPDFAADDNQNRYLYDSSGGKRYFVLKYNNASLNLLGIRLGDVTVQNIAYATWSPFWLQGQRNVLVVSGASGNTKVWLNGNLIANSATAWTPRSPSVLAIGANTGGASFFKGKITQFKIFNTALTEQEAIDYYNDTIYDYRNQQSLNLPMRAAEHDPVNVRTLDVSGNGKHAQFGDGSTPTTYPTKSGDRRGYYFDGGDYLKVTSGSGIFNAAGATVCVVFNPDFPIVSGSSQWLYDSENGKRYMAVVYGSGSLEIRSANTSIGIFAVAAIQPFWIDGGFNVLIVSGKSGDNSVFLNGQQVLSSGATAWTPSDPSYLNIGAAYNESLPFDGEFLSFQVWQRALTPLQVADLYLRLRKQLNDI